MRNMNRVSNSCKIGLKGCDFGGRSYVFRVVMQNLCKRVFFFFWKYDDFRVILPFIAKFCDLFFCKLLCLKDPINYTCLGVKLLHDYLFRVEKKYLFGVSNPTAILVYGCKF